MKSRIPYLISLYFLATENFQLAGIPFDKHHAIHTDNNDLSLGEITLQASQHDHLATTDMDYTIGQKYFCHFIGGTHQERER